MTQLNHRVLLEKPRAGGDSFGEPLNGSISLGKRWADVKLLSGLATILAGAELSVVKASIRFNFGTPLAAGMRVTYDGTVFDIKAVLPTGDRRYVDCTCEAVK
ncbi:MAG: phage head closure protein [Pseudomonadota bacterium]|nr:phage head closure protein [Pseudomonadota bacterium]